ncbi:hypothetical protein GCM10027414_23850 [Humibacter ginsengiterrae]
MVVDREQHGTGREVDGPCGYLHTGERKLPESREAPGEAVSWLAPPVFAASPARMPGSAF